MYGDSSKDKETIPSRKIKSLLSGASITMLERFPTLTGLVHMDKSCVITDSGGVIRESYFAGKFSIVPLINSWWKNVVRAGWSIEVADNGGFNSW